MGASESCCRYGDGCMREKKIWKSVVGKTYEVQSDHYEKVMVLIDVKERSGRLVLSSNVNSIADFHHSHKTIVAYELDEKTKFKVTHVNAVNNHVVMHCVIQRVSHKSKIVAVSENDFIDFSTNNHISASFKSEIKICSCSTIFNICDDELKPCGLLREVC